MTATAPADPFDVATIKADFPLLQQEIKGRPIRFLDSAAS